MQDERVNRPRPLKAVNILGIKILFKTIDRLKFSLAPAFLISSISPLRDEDAN